MTRSSHPIDSEPLRARLFPGMQLTIAFDDISLPLPKMRRPDIRQRIIEAVLDIAAEVGVDDVHLIAALALHRRMTEAELRYCLGDRIYDAFAPRGQLYNHDAEDPDGMELIGETRHGEEVQISKRAATSDLIVYVNINLVSMDGGWKSTATGLSGYQALRHHHNVATMRATRSFMDQEHSELHRSNWRQGEVLRDAGHRDLPDRDDGQQRPVRRRSPVGARQARVGVVREGPPDLPRRAEGSGRDVDQHPSRVMHSWEAPYALTSVQAGEVEAVHKLTTQHVYDQQLVPVEGQTDVVLYGLPYVGPYNVNSIMNPILVMCLGLGYFFNMYRGRPVVREGGVLIMTHPTTNEFHPVHHPSYIDFFEQVLAETTDPLEIEQRYEQSYATDEWYRHLYRTSYAYHGVHPVLHVVLGQPRARAPGAGDHRRRRPGDGAAARLPSRLHPGGRAGDGHRRGGPLPHGHLREEPAAGHGGRDVSTRVRTDDVQDEMADVT